MKKVAYMAALVPIFIALWLMGDAPKTPVYHTNLIEFIEEPSFIDAYFSKKESAWDVKLDNEAKIIWANDSLKAKTEYSVLYLHGFGASQYEGNPVHQNFAHKYGFNLVLSRLYDHGLNDSLPMLNFTVQKYWDSAIEYLSIARAVGDKVIVIGTSTGGTLALQMAALFDDVEAVILLSPNIKVSAKGSRMLAKPWGRNIARFIRGSDVVVSSNNAPWYSQYWYRSYSMNGVVEMQKLLETSMTKEVFNSIYKPVLLLYYYKDEENQDRVVSVAAMHKMFEQLATPTSSKVKVALPNAGDHVIGCHLRSADILGVEKAICDFAETVLGL